MSEFKVTERVEGSNLILALQGSIDEDASFPSIEPGKYSQIRLDLKNIKAINSVGIREWLDWIRPISEASEIVLENCPKAMVFQFNMVEGFLPQKSKVLSFFVPFYCEKCDREDNLLFTVGKDVSLAAGSLSITHDAKQAVGCAEAACELEMDVTEAKYFQFLKKG